MKKENEFKEAIKMLLENDRNSTLDDILTENYNNYYKAHKQLLEEIKETRDRYIEDDLEVYEFYDKVAKILGE